MKIKVGSKIRIEDPSADIKNYCSSKLVLDNPDFIKKERLGKWTGNTPRYIYLYEIMGNEIWLPFGCLKTIWGMYPVKSAYTLEFGVLRQVSYKSHINPYPYQEKAISSALRAKNGVLVMPCGSGKTQCGLEIISRLGGRALWLTHTHELLNQSKQRAEACLLQGGYGVISAGKVNIGTHITFATIQTLSKLDLTDYRDYWDIIVVDEAQHCCGSPTRTTQFYKVLSRLSARYKYGLTATPKRTDGLQQSMFALLGDKIAEITKEDVADNTCPIQVQTIETKYVPEYDAILQGDGTIDYMRLIDALTHDENRLKFVCDLINKYAGHGEPMIVLGNRIEYLMTLCNEYNKLHSDKGLCLSASAKKVRKSALEALNSGELDVIFATYQLAAEGLDVPRLKYIVFATPEKNEITVTQAAGRVGRKADGKECGVVIDLLDDFGMYRNWYKERLKSYKKINAEVV